MTRQTIDKLLKVLLLGWIVMTLVLIAVVARNDESNRTENSHPAPNIALMAPPTPNILC